ncbi:MAG TPA: hypothetical protein VG502_00220 [Flexivirga sp.]|uniref:hypothetical protein n=1 Tax=Flexivirga sp. TaxID=1962927 RepID=UPI002C38184C|nr:hypothetical protein [Flexivirga sp.]HWC20695.1 hypothetical protein [Flexivirga sp.]
MGTIPCRANDGECAIPGRALVVTEGQLSVVTARAAERMFPDGNFASTADDAIQLTREFGAAIESLGDRYQRTDSPYDRLVDLVLAARLAESPIADLSDAEARQYFAREQLAMVESAFARESSDDGVIVYCTPCGHIWKLLESRS